MKNWSPTRMRRTTLACGIFTLAVWWGFFLGYLASDDGLIGMALISPVGLLAGSWLIARAVLPDEQE